RGVSIGTFVAVLRTSVLLTLWLVKKGRIRLALTLGFVIGSAVFVTSLPGEFGIILGVTIVWRISNPRIRAVTIAMLWLPAFLYFTACGLLLLPISDFNAAWTADSVLRIGYWLIMLAAVVLMWWKESSKWPALQNRPDPTYGQVL
ncbi:MAG: hypothetical protein QGD94_10815, partial [Planctomycetia bacterium]|nr:hypothetical protein [Planctomycetia bacterium]